ncbi:pseudouridine synthase [Peziza echinospora]|nr:pseudouridine synthase [Peziza echinospora]
MRIPLHTTPPSASGTAATTLFLTTRRIYSGITTLLYGPSKELHSPSSSAIMASAAESAAQYAPTTSAAPSPAATLDCSPKPQTAERDGTSGEAPLTPTLAESIIESEMPIFATLSTSETISEDLLPTKQHKKPKKPPPPPGSWPKKVRPQQAQRSLMDELRPVYKPTYYFEDGLRRVVPYHYTYNTFCKERWRGKSLLEIFLTEFRDRPEEYYTKAITNGAVTINGKIRSTIDTTIKNGDIISHTLHRHEPPVTDKPIGIVYEDDNLICINKPPGVPVHPAGRYNFNTVVEIMRSEREGFSPLPCNRLDRLTSGLMFIAKTPSAADAMMTQLRTRTIKKTYLARVKGLFPPHETLCTQPILAISPKLGLNRVRANGKSARTVFRRLRYNKEKDYSIVECLPLTGRTHQIRVHLQWLGHPITNDPIYSNLRVWGIELGKEGAGEDEDIITRLSLMGKTEVAHAWDYYNDMMGGYEKGKAEKMTGALCGECEAPLYSDPGEHELGIYLHAKRYECVDGAWSYETEAPEWALLGEESGVTGELGEEVGVLRELEESVIVVEDA